MDGRAAARGRARDAARDIYIARDARLPVMPPPLLLLLLHNAACSQVVEATRYNVLCAFPPHTPSLMPALSRGLQRQWIDEGRVQSVVVASLHTFSTLTAWRPNRWLQIWSPTICAQRWLDRWPTARGKQSLPISTSSRPQLALSHSPKRIVSRRFAVRSHYHAMVDTNQNH